MGALLLDLWPALAYGAFYVPFTILSARPEKNLPPDHVRMLAGHGREHARDRPRSRIKIT